MPSTKFRRVPWMITMGAIVASSSLMMSNPAAAAEAGKVTFSNQVVRIFQEKCQDCHRSGTVAPMSLVTYEETRPWARSIKERVLSAQMPPWHIDKTVGMRHFSNDMSLSDDADRDDREVGGLGRAGGRPEGHAAAEAVARR